ncbi:hypothetical protein [Streptomyces sp. NPDC020917]|uniref:hypothetical protein n=1 Tax=Streptomyces sp. NPDC020917 TaxID=3365102 RepID=UPI0037B22978
MGQTERVQQRLTAEGAADERVLYGLLAFRIGGVRKTMVGGAAGIAGLAGAAAMAAAARGGRGTAPAVMLELPGRCILGLTGRRLLVYKIGGLFAAKPGKQLYAFTLDQVAWVSEPELVPGVAQALRVQIAIKGQGVLAVEFPRLMVNDGRNMINRLLRELPEEPAEQAEPAPAAEAGKPAEGAEPAGPAEPAGSAGSAES